MIEPLRWKLFRWVFWYSHGHYGKKRYHKIIICCLRKSAKASSPLIWDNPFWPLEMRTNYEQLLSRRVVKLRRKQKPFSIKSQFFVSFALKKMRDFISATTLHSGLSSAHFSGDHTLLLLGIPTYFLFDCCRLLWVFEEERKILRLPFFEFLVASWYCIFHYQKFNIITSTMKS